MEGNDDLVVLRPEGLYCAAGDFHIDPWRPVPRAVITHGHGDHARPGMGEYHCSEGSLPILRWRLGDVGVQAHAEGVPFRLGRVQVSLHPAGHVLGSSQVRIDDGERVWVASGDYKRQPDPTCTPFEVVPCDTFITEATFALPIYRWPDTPAVAAEIVAWRRECEQRGEAAILLCYALGKAQRVLAELLPLDDRPAWLHGAIANGVAVYRQAGVAIGGERGPVIAAILFQQPEFVFDRSQPGRRGRNERNRTDKRCGAKQGSELERHHRLSAESAEPCIASIGPARLTPDGPAPCKKGNQGPTRESGLIGTPSLRSSAAKWRMADRTRAIFCL